MCRIVEMACYWRVVVVLMCMLVCMLVSVHVVFALALVQALVLSWHGLCVRTLHTY